MEDIYSQKSVAYASNGDSVYIQSEWRIPLTCNFAASNFAGKFAA